jgi:hypothetical protein
MAKTQMLNAIRKRSLVESGNALVKASNLALFAELLYDQLNNNINDAVNGINLSPLATRTELNAAIANTVALIPNVSSFVNEQQVLGILQYALANNEDLAPIIIGIVEDIIDDILSSVTDNVTASQVEAMINSANTTLSQTINSRIDGVDSRITNETNALNTAITTSATNLNNSLRQWANGEFYNSNQVEDMVVGSINLLNAEITATHANITFGGSAVASFPLMSDQDVSDIIDSLDRGA